MNRSRRFRAPALKTFVTLVVAALSLLGGPSHARLVAARVAAGPTDGQPPIADLLLTATELPSEIAQTASSSSVARRGFATQVGPSLELPRGPVYVYNGDLSRRRIAFTLDAGADRGNAGPILDLLLVEGIKVTFGITGHWADANPDLTKRIVDEGHSLINHTYTHGSLTGFATKKPAMSAEQIRLELQRTEDSVKRITGGTTKPWFRPPFIDMDARTMGVVADAGYPLIAMHTVDSLGWQGLSPDRVVARCREKATPGGIFIFHVGQQSTDFLAFPKLIAGLRADGYEITSLPGVLSSS